MKKICLVIGMGRSGTSLIANILQSLGVNFGEHTHQANEYNEKGYFEDGYIVEKNERALAHLRADKPVPEWAKGKGGPLKEWLYLYDYSNEDILSIPDQIKNEIKQVIEKDLLEYEFPAIKDPRITLLMPLYLEVCRELELIPYFVHAHREPKEVAKSLYKFWDFKVPEDVALKLCDQYNSIAESYEETVPYIPISFNEVVKDPLPQAKMLAQFLGLQENYNKEKEEEILGLVDEKLHHNKS